MQVEAKVGQENEVVELSLEQIDIVAGGFPVVPPLGGGG